MLYNHFTEKLLGLKGVFIKNITQQQNNTQIDIEIERKVMYCPCCGTATRTIHDYRRQQIKDIPAFGKHMLLYLRKRRYRCPRCNKRFFEDVSFLPRYHRMTTRLSAYVISKLSETSSISSVAREVYFSVSTVIRIFDGFLFAKSTSFSAVN